MHRFGAAQKGAISNDELAASGRFGLHREARIRIRKVHPMRILHVIHSIRASTGGPARALQDLVPWLVNAGVDCKIACCESDAESLCGPVCQFGGTVVEHLGCGRWKSLVSKSDPLLERLVSEADIVHIHGIWEGTLVAACRAARAAGKPSVCSPHGMLAPWSMSRHRLRKLPYFHLFTRPMLRNLSAMQFTTQAELEHARSRLNPIVRSFVAPVILSDAFYREMPPRETAESLFPQIPTDGAWVLFLARLHPVKGLEKLVEAFPGVLKRFPRAQLVIAGSGDPAYEKLIRRMVLSLGINDSTHFVGMVHGAAKVALYRRAAILAVPSRHENFGIVFAESLACETPVLLTPQVDIHQEIMQAGAGFLVEDSPNAIAVGLLNALCDAPKSRAAGKAGRKWVLEYLAPEKVTNRQREFYERVLSDRPK